MSEIESVAVVGGGLMGTGIAESVAVGMVASGRLGRKSGRGFCDYEQARPASG
jgi:3-hydroxyacyl-CoA dehydrogenase